MNPRATWIFLSTELHLSTSIHTSTSRRLLTSIIPCKEILQLWHLKGVSKLLYGSPVTSSISFEIFQTFWFLTPSPWGHFGPKWPIFSKLANFHQKCRCGLKSAKNGLKVVQNMFGHCFSHFWDNWKFSIFWPQNDPRPPWLTLPCTGGQFGPKMGHISGYAWSWDLRLIWVFRGS